MAWWSSADKSVTCLACQLTEPTAEAPTRTATVTSLTSPSETSSTVTSSSLVPVEPIDHGVGGVSAAKEYDRRTARHDRQIEAKWGVGRVGRIAKFLSNEPQSTVAWAKGAEGERRLALRLTVELSDVAIVLHDRKVLRTRGNIDHIVVAATGVWVIDAKNYSGKVEQRDLGGWFKTDKQLYVDGRKQPTLVAGLGWQADAVRAALDAFGRGAVTVHSALCFIGSDWEHFAKPFRIDGVLVTWPAKLIEAIRETGPEPIDTVTINEIGRGLSTRLRAAT